MDVACAGLQLQHHLAMFAVTSAALQPLRLLRLVCLVLLSSLDTRGQDRSLPHRNLGAGARCAPIRLLLLRLCMLLRLIRLSKPRAAPSRPLHARLLRLPAAD